MTFLLLVFTLLLLSSVKSAEIVSFTQSPDIVAPDENATFVCEAIGHSGEWRIDNVLLRNSDPDRGYFIGNMNKTGDNLLLTLTVTSYERNNGSEITCFIFRGDIRQDKVLIIAGPPSETHPMISYNQSGLSLTVSWEEPFTHPGFNITEYSLQIVNRSSNAAMTRTVPVGLDRVYVDTVDAPPSQCNELDYIVTAFNSIGNSTASVSGGFPIIIDSVKIQWRVLYQIDGVPHLELWFQPFPVCSFQELEYFVYLEGLSVNTTFHKSDILLYNIHEGLTAGSNYTAIVEEISVNRVKISREDIVIKVPNFPCTQLFPPVTDAGTQLFPPVPTDAIHSQQLVVATLNAVIGILAVVSVISFLLFLIFCFLYCKLKKETKGHMIDFVSPLADTVVAGNSQCPTTLQTSLAVTKLNPIYDGGPVYDSCGGEPLRGLLSNTSTPSTPNTPVLEESIRYVFPPAPPELPPPRIAPYCTMLQATAVPPTVDGEKIVNKEDLGSSEYTVMRPARGLKPSPLVLSS